MVKIVQILALLLLLGVGPSALAQGFIDTPCDPSSPLPQCQGQPHLTCEPMFNLYNNGTCRCASGTFWHPQALECRVPSGGSCQNSSPDAPTCTPNAACDFMSNTCQCNSGYYVPSIGSFCVTSVGQPCGDWTSTNAQCDITKRLICGGPNPPATVCVCSGRDLWSDKRDKCLGTVGTSSACSVDDDCVENAVCTINDFGIARCRCAPGFSETVDNTCSLAFGSACDSNPAAALKCNEKEFLECSAANNTCVCAGGRQAQDSVCRGLAGHSCDADADCLGNSLLLCHQEVKQCFCSQQQQTIPLVDGTCGRLGRGGYCRPGQFDCSSLEYLVCNHITGTEYGRCGCQSGFTMDSNGRCRRPLDAACQPTNHNCVENAACIRDQCTCLPGTSPTPDGRCLKSFNEVCNVGTLNQCNPEAGLQCTQSINRCQCPTGQEWDEGRAHCVAMVSGNCTSGADSNFCVAHASCNDRGICECDVGYSQYTTYDRHCFASHGTPCNVSDPSVARCNDQEYLFCDAETNTCLCEYSSQQVWDNKTGACLSLVGSHCGTYLGEHMNRRMQCVDSAMCLQDSNHVSKCLCSEEESMEPDGAGRCRKMAILDNGASAATGLGALFLSISVVLASILN